MTTSGSTWTPATSTTASTSRRATCGSPRWRTTTRTTPSVSTWTESCGCWTGCPSSGRSRHRSSDALLGLARRVGPADRPRRPAAETSAVPGRAQPALVPRGGHSPRRRGCGDGGRGPRRRRRGRRGRMGTRAGRPRAGRRRAWWTTRGPCRPGSGSVRSCCSEPCCVAGWRRTSAPVACPAWCSRRSASSVGRLRQRVQLHGRGQRHLGAQRVAGRGVVRLARS